MSRFKSFHYHTTEEAPAAPAVPAGLGMAEESVKAARETDEAEVRPFLNDESAARNYLDRLWSQADEGPLFQITAPESPALVPDLRLGKVQESPATDTRLLHFDQRANDVPVLGAKAVVELKPDRSLVSIDAQIADKPDVSPVAKISPAQALKAIAKTAGVTQKKLGKPATPRLAYFRDDDGTWHLVYEVRNVAAAPPEYEKSVAETNGHGLGASPRQDHVELTYLVDAHDGSIVLYYSERPWLIETPVLCVGADELQSVQKFFGAFNGTAFELRDPVRKIRTFDMNFANLSSGKLPAAPVSSSQFDFAKSNTAAVSAHVNATRVFDFYNDVLKRDGVDDKRMELISIVNTTYQPPQSKDWKNAVWYQNRMWYGQVKNANGGFDSYSRYLDVIAHELTHGVTETTAALKYLNESGALNESFSDIFGIMVRNLNTPNANDLSKWDWELGKGLGKNGKTLRDLQDPTRTGDPAHMKDFKKLPPSSDSGGVHTNSNIHNKAAYNTITSKRADGTYLFTPQESALLFYLTLTRLTAFATFADVLSTLQNVLKTLYMGRPDEIAERVNAVVAAYDAVGIH